MRPRRRATTYRFRRDRSFPRSLHTLLCLLDRLNELPIEYRWIGCYLPMDKSDAMRQLNKLSRQ